MSKHSLKRVNPPTPEKERPTVDETAADELANELDAAFDGEDTKDGEQFEDAAQRVVEKAQAVARVERHAPPALADSTGGQLVGGFDQSDIKTPMVKVVQGSTPLKEEFLEGTVVLNEVLLLEPPPLKEDKPIHQFRFIPFSLRKQFRQNLTDEEQKAGEMPAIVDSIEEVHELGGTTQWIGKQKPSWSPLGHVSMLIEQPEDNDDPQFNLQFGDKSYAIATYMAGGSAYTHCPKVILNNALSMLLEPVIDPATQKPVLGPTGLPKKKPVLYKCYWTFHVVRQKVRDFLIFQPRVKLLSNEPVDPEIRAFLEERLQTLLS